MTAARRLFMALWVALAVIAMPLAHAAAMGINAESLHGAHHHHGESAEASEPGCHHNVLPLDQQPTSDPNPICGTYSVCHMGGVLPSVGIALVAPERILFADAITHTPIARNSKPPLAPPRS